MRFPLFACLAACLPSLAHAAPVTLIVRGVDGRPVANAVVTLTEAGVPAPLPRGPYAVEQRDISFQPHILIVPVGATVAFPNRDRVRHHVYSFSQAKRFDLKLYGHDDSRQVLFDKPGPVMLGCNIHDQMSGVVFVTATPFAVVTGADGMAKLDVPVGRAMVSIWHPAIRAPGNVQAQGMVIAPGGLATTIGLRR